MDNKESGDFAPPINVKRTEEQIVNNVPALVIDGQDVMKKLKWGQAALFISIVGFLLAAATAGVFVFLMYIGTSH